AVAVLDRGGPGGLGVSSARAPQPDGGGGRDRARLIEYDRRFIRWDYAAVNDIIDELTWRGLIAVSTDLDDLRKALNTDVVTFYGGFDPTAPSLHSGNLVLLQTMRRLQLPGHRPIGLVSGATGLIGAPSGKSTERVLNPLGVVADWVTRIRGEIRRFLDFAPGPTGALAVSKL